MNTAMTQKRLAEVFDEVTREVTEQFAGICLHKGGAKPSGNLCTVYAEFERGFRTGLSLCAEVSMFTRLTRYMMQTDAVSPQDVEDFSKEFFNVLCGRIAARMFRVTKVPARFGIPAFYHGRYVPDGHREHFILHYTSDGAECAELIHLTPPEIRTVS